MTKGKK